MELVSKEDFRDLLDYFSKNVFRPKDEDPRCDFIQRKCRELFAKDYKVTDVDNTDSKLASTYPSHLFLIQEFQGYREPLDLLDRSSSLYDTLTDPSKLRELILKARIARCRGRFPFPVILYNGKYICRSSTLSGGPEIYTRSGYEYLFADHNEPVTEEDEEVLATLSLGDWQLFSKVRSQDIRLLKTFSVGYICDLMVEKKKVKFGVNVTSSEKVDKENRYSDFTILSLPFPGCEFFRDFRNNGYNAENLIFDWNQGFVDAHLGLPSDSIGLELDVDWTDYKNWDLVKLTKNYIKLLLKFIVEGTSGMLIHCISGWDRTPLYISMLRLSLWADGKIHASLTPLEITYLTVAYDWFMFGHNLTDRMSKGEEILYFCFYMLKHIGSEEFSVLKIKNRRTSGNSSDGHVDGVLFEEYSSQVRGSNTSLNSTSSSISSPSQESNPPLLFTAHDSGDENILNTSNGNVADHQSISPNHWNPVEWSPPKLEEMQSSRSNTPPTLTNSSDNGIYNANEPMVIGWRPVTSNLSTSPVAVPSSARQRSESSSSAGCGSWQFISSTGSIRGSGSNRSSISSPTLELNQNAANSKSNLYQDSFECHKISQGYLSRAKRMERLQSVRCIFNGAYSSINFKNCNETGGLSSIIDQFAEKVGIKSGRTNV